jgi:hypothetical protein
VGECTLNKKWRDAWLPRELGKFSKNGETFRNLTFSLKIQGNVLIHSVSVCFKLLIIKGEKLILQEDTSFVP